MSIRTLLAASAMTLIASCASEREVHEQVLTALPQREQKIVVTSGCASMFAYAAQFDAPRQKELYLRKSQYMTNHLFSELGVTGTSDHELVTKGSLLTRDKIILQMRFDGGFRYSQAMADCETIYNELLKASKALPVQSAATYMPGTQIFELVKPSVWTLVSFDVRLGKPDWDGAAQGSAVAVGRNTLLTNCHTLRGHSNHMIMQSDVRYLPVNTASADYVTDRCVLKTSNDILKKYVEIRPSVEIDVGEEAYSIGAPSGLDLTMADGIVSAKRMIKGVPRLQTTAPISKGSSGGGLFDRRGRLMGITTFYLDGGQNLNFAIAADQF